MLGAAGWSKYFSFQAGEKKNEVARGLLDIKRLHDGVRLAATGLCAVEEMRWHAVGVEEQLGPLAPAEDEELACDASEA